MKKFMIWKISDHFRSDHPKKWSEIRSRSIVWKMIWDQIKITKKLIFWSDLIWLQIRSTLLCGWMCKNISCHSCLIILKQNQRPRKYLLGGIKVSDICKKFFFSTPLDIKSRSTKATDRLLTIHKYHEFSLLSTYYQKCEFAMHMTNMSGLDKALYGSGLAWHLFCLVSASTS